MITELERRTAELIASSILPHNVLETHRIAEQMNNAVLMERCFQVILENGEFLLNQNDPQRVKEFVEISHALLSQIVNSDDLVAEEKTVFNAVIA